MNGPDLIALKSDDPRQKASTRAIPSSPPAAAVRIPLAGSLRLLSYLDQKKNRRGLCLAGVSSHWPAACVSAHEACASPTPPSGAEERPPRPACGTAAVRRGRLKGLRSGRAARAAEGATRPPCAATCAVAMRRGTRTAGAGEGATACGAPSTVGVPRGVSPRLDNRPPMASQGRGSAPTNDWTTCSRLGGGRGWPRGKRSSGQRSRIRGDSHHPAGFSAVPNVPLLTNGQMVRRIQLLLLLLFLLGALLCICRN